MAAPSKDRRDYQTPGRWEGRGGRWVDWLTKDAGAPYPYRVGAGLVGLVIGGLLGAWAGWELFAGAAGGGVITQLALDGWWHRRSRQHKPR